VRSGDQWMTKVFLLAVFQLPQRHNVIRNRDAATVQRPLQLGPARAALCSRPPRFQTLPMIMSSIPSRSERI